jgi:hypothetical protein
MAGMYKLGVFSEEEKMVSSLKKLLEEGFTIYDVYMPYPVHEVLHLLKRKSKIPTAAYFYGLFGAGAVLAFLYYAAVLSWPIVYGGKPFNSFPSFIVITVVITILVVTILSLGTFSAASGLYPGAENPVFDERVTNDKFVIVIDTNDLAKDRLEAASGIFTHEGAEEVKDTTMDKK